MRPAAVSPLRRARAMAALAAVVLAIVAAAATPPPSSASSVPEDPRAAFERIQQEASGADERTEATMTLLDAGGSRHARAAIFLQKTLAAGRTARRIEFRSPPEMEGCSLLAIENEERGPDWWIYLPAYHTTRRIASADRGETYMGTDYSYEDLTDLRAGDHAFAWIGEEMVDGVACRKLEVRPLALPANEASLYSRKVYWVEKDRPVWRRALLYGRDGQERKEARNSEPVIAGGRARWNRTELRDLRSGHVTQIVVQNRRFDALPERLFTERSLRSSA
ncbi:MAG: outer membrane lipoprotein-sorting protein [Candidatus Eisenbacteria bacterium]|nr:outer membrane lipoprotein-sorting protein [Candidatus Eisenbacteria bacterium]